MMGLNHETPKQRIVESGGDIKNGKHVHPGRKDLKLLHWRAKGSSHMFEGQYRLERRSVLYWIAACTITSFLALMSSRPPVPWAPSSFLNQLSTLFPPSSPIFPEVHSSDAQILEEAAPVRGFDRTDQVHFDNYSLILRGQRIFLQ